MDAFPSFPKGFPSLLSPVGEHTRKLVRWLQRRSKGIRTGNDYVCGGEGGIPGVRFIPCMQVSPGFKGSTIARKS